MNLAQVSAVVVLVASVIAVTTGLFVLFEKLTGSSARWFERRLAVGMKPTVEALEALERYQRYHLGPNGDTDAIHRRLGNVEKQLVELRFRDLD
jgi:hypothetical protein